MAQGLVGARFAAWKARLLDLFFPRHCVGCGQEGCFLCPRCLARAPAIGPPWCPTCGLHLPAEVSCRSCASYPLALEGIRSAYAYQSPMREALIQFKYRGVRSMGGELAALLARYVASHPLPADLLVPVPLHPRRHRERGYNQAEVLSQELGRLTGLPVAPGALVRVRDTPFQARTSSREERQQNVQGAFAPGPESVSGKRVLLVDDVCTTGATLSACGVALRAAGVASVWGLTVAREE